MDTVKETIQCYYEAFNAENDNEMCSLLHDQVIHDINQGGQEIGVDKFKAFMDHMRNCYDEKVYNLIIFSNEEGHRGSAEFFVKGSYKKTDAPLPEAKGQTYDLRVGAFFELKDGKISRVTTYYNLKDWLKMVEK